MKQFSNFSFKPKKLISIVEPEFNIAIGEDFFSEAHTDSEKREKMMKTLLDDNDDVLVKIYI